MTELSQLRAPVVGGATSSERINAHHNGFGPRGVTPSREDRSVLLAAAHPGLRAVDNTKPGLSNCSPAAISACKPLRASCRSLSVTDNDAISVAAIFIESKKKKRRCWDVGGGIRFNSKCVVIRYWSDDSIQPSFSTVQRGKYWHGCAPTRSCFKPECC